MYVSSETKKQYIMFLFFFYKFSLLEEFFRLLEQFFLEQVILLFLQMSLQEHPNQTLSRRDWGKYTGIYEEI